MRRWPGRTRAGAAPAWLADRLSAVRGFAVYLAGSGLPVGVPGTRQGPSGSRRATPYLFTNADVQAVMRAAEELFTPLRGHDDHAGRDDGGHRDADR